MAETAEIFYATGRRKEATARVRLRRGEGRIIVNGRSFDEFFRRETSRMIILQPFEILNVKNQYDVLARVNGGGSSGQAGALRHGISRALTKVDSQNRGPLKKAGMLTRDPRAKERKKCGQRGARARFQFSKR